MTGFYCLPFLLLGYFLVSGEDAKPLCTDASSGYSLTQIADRKIEDSAPNHIGPKETPGSTFWAYQQTPLCLSAQNEYRQYNWSRDTNQFSLSGVREFFIRAGLSPPHFLV